MKIEKINFTIFCLTLITVVDIIATGGGISILLWFGYGIYWLDKD